MGKVITRLDRYYENANHFEDWPLVHFLRFSVCPHQSHMNMTNCVLFSRLLKRSESGRDKRKEEGMKGEVEEEEKE